MAETKKAPAKTTEGKAEEKVLDTKVTDTKALEGKADVKKETVKKPAVKTAVTKKPAAAKNPVAGRKPAEVKKSATAKKTSVSEAVNFEFNSKSYTPDDLVKIAKDVWKYDLKKKPADIKSVELYVKPEENLAYYVINGDVTGSFLI